MSRLSDKEIGILEEAKVANAHWFNAVIYCASIMSSRRKKYAGTHHPYYNFVDMAYRLGEKVVNIFRFYLNIKVSRIGASHTDFPDESVKDSYADAANYALIACGWLLDDLRASDVITLFEWTQDQERMEDMVDDDKDL